MQINWTVISEILLVDNSPNLVVYFISDKSEVKGTLSVTNHHAGGEELEYTTPDLVTVGRKLYPVEVDIVAVESVKKHITFSRQNNNLETVQDVALALRIRFPRVRDTITTTGVLVTLSGFLLGVQCVQND